MLIWIMPGQPECIRELCILALHAPDDATLLETMQELRTAITAHNKAFRGQAADDIQRFSINEGDLYLFLEDSTATVERSETEQE
jgi:hypothetical protein